MVVELLFDPVLSGCCFGPNGTNGSEFDFPNGLRPLCSHCHRRIEGKVYREKGKYYDSYCFGLRAVIEAGADRRERCAPPHYTRAALHEYLERKQKE